MAESPLTQQILMLAQQVQAGRVAPHLMLGKLEELESRIADAERQFTEEISGNPEYPPEAVERLLDAFFQYHEGVATLRLELMQGGINVEAGLSCLVRGAEGMDAASQLHLQALAQAGTAFPAINRLLLHLRLRSGAPYLDAAVEGFAGFLEQMRATLAAQQTRAAHPQAYQEGMALLEDLHAALDVARQVAAGASERAAEVENTLANAAPALAAVVNAYVDASLHHGPTPLPVLNLALRAVDGVERGTVTPDQAVALLTATQNELAQRWDSMGVPWAADAFETLLATLAYVASQLHMHAPTENASEAVREAAYALSARMRSPSWSEEDNLLNFRDDMLDATGRSRSGVGFANLQNLLDLGEAVLDGTASADALLGAAARMEQRVLRQREAVHQGSDSPEQQQAFEQGAVAILEGLEALRHLAASGDRQGLEAARSLFSSAVDHLAPMRTT
ncbi:MAG: hypothetical protein ACYCW6_29515 [Candidatus Xenobia bacterium]